MYIVRYDSESEYKEKHCKIFMCVAMVCALYTDLTLTPECILLGMTQKVNIRKNTARFYVWL